MACEPDLRRAIAYRTGVARRPCARRPRPRYWSFRCRSISEFFGGYDEDRVYGLRIEVASTTRTRSAGSMLLTRSPPPKLDLLNRTVVCAFRNRRRTLSYVSSRDAEIRDQCHTVTSADVRVVTRSDW